MHQARSSVSCLTNSEEAYSFVAYLSHATIYHASLARRIVMGLGEGGVEGDGKGEEMGGV